MGSRRHSRAEPELRNRRARYFLATTIVLTVALTFSTMSTTTM
jgi:hypothetical protein